MDPLKLPSLVHYELILQVLERQTMIAADRDPIVRERVQQLIVTLRKALSQHKLLEDTCRNQQVEIEHVWALNSVVGKQEVTVRDWETGRLGDWETGGLGDWETGRLGDGE